MTGEQGHAASLLAILEREQRRQEQARLHAHKYNPAPTRAVCVDCGLGEWYHEGMRTRR